jgi:chromosome partitioning protein
MLDETLAELAAHDLAPDLNFIRIVASKVDENKSIQKELLGLMRQVFGLAMIRTPLKDSAEIDNVTARLRTVYEIDGPMTSKSVRDRCLTYLNGVNGEVLVDVRSTWPSHAERLRKEGHQ